MEIAYVAPTYVVQCGCDFLLFRGVFRFPLADAEYLFDNINRDIQKTIKESEDSDEILEAKMMACNLRIMEFVRH